MDDFAPAENCPHVSPTDQIDLTPTPSTIDEADELIIAAINGEASVENSGQQDTPVPPAMVYLGGDEALTVEESDRITANTAAPILLLAGEIESGKTTLLAELYGRFLEGPLAGWDFAGSETLMAFEEALKASMEESGNEEARTERTVYTNIRLLHYCLSRQDTRDRIDLLATDVRGELFEHIANGVPVGDEVPIARRADRVVVVLDGAKVGDKFKRANVVSSTVQLVGGLCAAGGLRPKTPLLFVLSKVDLAGIQGVAFFKEKCGEQLIPLAESAGMVATALEIAARPSGGATPIGLEEFLRWSGQPRSQTVEELPALPRDDNGRHFWAAGSA